MARILIAEDCEFQRTFLDNVLRLAGHETALAADGRKAIKLLDESAFDLVITDILMPGCDGIELIQSLRRAQCRTPVLAMTGDNGAGCPLPYLQFARAFGAAAQLVKSASVHELLSAVAGLLRDDRVAA